MGSRTATLTRTVTLPLRPSGSIAGVQLRTLPPLAAAMDGAAAHISPAFAAIPIIEAAASAARSAAASARWRATTAVVRTVTAIATTNSSEEQVST
jgi:hypothetical protein